MFKKMKISEKLFINTIIVALIAGMVVWVRYQVIEIQDVINRNKMPAIEFIMKFSLFQNSICPVIKD